MNETETITVPHFEGFKCIGYGIPKKGEYYLGGNGILTCTQEHVSPWLIYEKLPPKRYIFEETGEYRKVKPDEYFLTHGGLVKLWLPDEPSLCAYKILKQVYEE